MESMKNAVMFLTIPLLLWKLMQFHVNIQNLLYGIITGIQSSGADAASSSSLPPCISTAKSVGELLSEIAPVASVLVWIFTFWCHALFLLPQKIHFLITFFFWVNIPQGGNRNIKRCGMNLDICLSLQDTLIVEDAMIDCHDSSKLQVCSAYLLWT